MAQFIQDSVLFCVRFDEVLQYLSYEKSENNKWVMISHKLKDKQYNDKQ